MFKLKSSLTGNINGGNGKKNKVIDSDMSDYEDDENYDSNNDDDDDDGDDAVVFSAREKKIGENKKKLGTGDDDDDDDEAEEDDEDENNGEDEDYNEDEDGNRILDGAKDEDADDDADEDEDYNEEDDEGGDDETAANNKPDQPEVARNYNDDDYETNNDLLNHSLLDDDDEDDVDEDPDAEGYHEKYVASLQKLKGFDSFINTFHPETQLHNDMEIYAATRTVRNLQNIIIDDFHKTVPYLTKYEKARILGIRSREIESGAAVAPGVEIPNSVIDSYRIAQIELEQKAIPFIIRRPIPNGGFEYWRLEDLEII